MATITLNYNARSIQAKNMLKVILAMGVFNIDESSYAKKLKSSLYGDEFSNKIDESERQFKEGKFRTIKTSDIWN